MAHITLEQQSYCCMVGSLTHFTGYPQQLRYAKYRSLILYWRRFKTIIPFLWKSMIISECVDMCAIHENLNIHCTMQIKGQHHSLQHTNKYTTIHGVIINMRVGLSMVCWIRSPGHVQTTYKQALVILILHVQITNHWIIQRFKLSN